MLCNIFTSEIFWIAATAIATMIMAYWTIKSVKEAAHTAEITAKQTRLNLAVELEMKLVHEFFVDMKQNRQLFAKQVKSFENEDDYEEMEDTVIDFFETLGMLFEKKALDEDLVWNDFSYYILHWWKPAQGYVIWLRQRHHDKTLYKQFDQLYKDMIKLDAKKREISKDKAIPTEEGIKKFLNDESKVNF